MAALATRIGVGLAAAWPSYVNMVPNVSAGHPINLFLFAIASLVQLLSAAPTSLRFSPFRHHLPVHCSGTGGHVAVFCPLGLLCLYNANMFRTVTLSTLNILTLFLLTDVGTGSFVDHAAGAARK